MNGNEDCKNVPKDKCYRNMKRSVFFSENMQLAINIAERQLAKQICIMQRRQNTRLEKKSITMSDCNYNIHAHGDVYSEIPIGCVIVDNDTGKVLARAHNETIKTNNPTRHAEIVCIDKAMRRLRTNRLTNCSMYVTLEPCCMCAGAISLAKIDRLYIGCLSRKTGAVVSNLHYFLRNNCNHRPDVYYPIMEEKCRGLLRGFFRDV